MQRRLLLAALVTAGLLAGWPGQQGAAGAQGRSAASRPLLQHSFPLAGRPLVIAVEGLIPHTGVALQLLDPANAPPSVVAALMLGAGNEQFLNGLLQGPDKFTTIWEADDFGRVVLTIPLEDAADANRAITLLAAPVAGSAPSEPLHLQVLPPTLLLPTRDGLVRINLLDGSLQLPSIPAAGGLRGAALSTDGVLGYVLREGGLLEVRATHQWDAEPLSRRVLDPDTDILAGGPSVGAAFALARPAGLPFTPGARLQFLDETSAGRSPLFLEPMGQLVAGRCVVITPDGMSAFIAEDDLIVREVDLLSGVARGLLAVGLAGDRAISDLLVDGRRLLVATRGPLGRRGSLTSFDLDAGRLAVRELDVDPLRLVPLNDRVAGRAAPNAGRVLVVPATGRTFQVLADGLPAGRQLADDGRWLDAVAVQGGALLLRETSGGELVLERFEPDTGLREITATGLPPVARLVGGGAGAVVLLGDPSGAVYVLRAPRGQPELLPGVTALPGETFAVIP